MSPGGTTSPYTISGALNFSPGGGALGSALGGGIGPAYTSAYNAALSQNQSLYNAILGGYQNTSNAQYGAQQGINSGYGQTATNQANTLGSINQGYSTLGSQVQQMLGLGQGGAVGPGGQVNPGGSWGIAAPAAQAIGQAYQQQNANTQQQLINSGLGNSTVLGSMQSGNTLGAAQAYAGLGAQLAQTGAGYASQIGLGQLGFQNQANQQNVAQSNLQSQYQNLANTQNTGQANQQLGFMNTVTAQYPNAQSYTQAAQNQAALGLAQQQFGLQRQLALAGLARAGAPGAPPIGGYTSSPGGSILQLPNYGGGSGAQVSPYQSAYLPQAIQPPTGYPGAQLAATGYPAAGNPQLAATGYPAAGSGGQSTASYSSSQPQQAATGYPDNPYATLAGDGYDDYELNSSGNYG